MSGMIGLLIKKIQLPPASAIAGKTILITGANTGLGKEAARHALTLGAGLVLLGVRSLDKGEQAKSDIISSFRSPAVGRVIVWQVDLESFESVQAFAARARQYVESEGGRIDAAIMNAGIASTRWARSPSGWERSLQVNVLSTALLSLYLMPLLLISHEREPSSVPHLTILTSDIHKSIKFRERDEGDILQALNEEKRWKSSQAAGGATERYGVTKLMDLYITIQLANLVPRDQQGRPLVVVNAITPGFCKSDLLMREKAPLMLKLVQAAVARTVEEGSKTLLHAVTQGMETHGKWLENETVADSFISPGILVTSSEAAALREKVWGEIVGVLHSFDPALEINLP